MRPIRPILCCVLTALLFPLLGAGVATASQAVVARPDVVTLQYSASKAPDYGNEILTAIGNWNKDVHNVHIVPVATGKSADFTFVEDNGWPHTERGDRLGTGKVVIGKEAVDQGADKTRIIAHEIGHILGLPDNRDGKCSTLMSGHSSPLSCKDADPNQAERAQVEKNFADRD